MRADSGHRRQRALEERRHDGLHAVRLALGEGPVQLREGVLREAAAHDRRDASVGPQSCVQDEDLDVEPAFTVPPLATVVAPVPVRRLGALVNGGTRVPISDRLDGRYSFIAVRKL